jgi:hypothetical protein
VVFVRKLSLDDWLDVALFLTGILGLLVFPIANMTVGAYGKILTLCALCVVLSANSMTIKRAFRESKKEKNDGAV